MCVASMCWLHTHTHTQHNANTKTRCRTKPGGRQRTAGSAKNTRAGCAFDALRFGTAIAEPSHLGHGQDADGVRCLPCLHSHFLSLSSRIISPPPPPPICLSSLSSNLFESLRISPGPPVFSDEAPVRVSMTPSHPKLFGSASSTASAPAVQWLPSS